MQSTKSGIKFKNRQLDDGAHREAEDLWVMSQMQMHPGASLKDSIANYVSLGQTKNVESLPYNTFKSGVVRHDFQTMSIDQNAEPDTFSREPSPLEFAALKSVPWLVPAKYEFKPSTYTEGVDDLMRAQKRHRYKTSYTKKSGRAVPYQRTDRTSTTLNTSNAAQSARAENVGLTSGGNADLGTSSATGLVTPQNIERLKRLGLKLVQQYAGGAKVAANDPDLIGLVQAGFTSENFTSLIKQIPGASSIPGINYVGSVLSVAAAGALHFAAESAKNKP